MCAQREEDVEADTSEEDGEHGHPFEILGQGTEERLLAETVAEHGQTDVTCAGEDDEQRDEDSPGFDVEFVDVAVVPADEEVVEECEGKTESDGVVGSDVAENGEFGGELHVGPEETAEEGCKGSLP